MVRENGLVSVGINRRDQGTFAHMVPAKGHDAHATKMVAREIKPTGYSKIILKSDQGPAVRQLKEAAKIEVRKA